MSRMIVFGGLRSGTRSIQTPESLSQYQGLWSVSPFMRSLVLFNTLSHKRS